MDKKLQGILHILLAVFIVAIALYFSDHIEELKEYGYLGVFFISLISAATIFFPAPGWAAVIAMATMLDPFLVGIAAGTGASFGELTGFFAGEGAREIINSRIKEFKKIESVVHGYKFLGVFFLAFLPSPLFDFAGIVAGSIRMHPAKFLLACALGRSIRYVLLAYFGAWAIGLVL
jgi:membrane protein YqaA with SNARE-associated domain